MKSISPKILLLLVVFSIVAFAAGVLFAQTPEKPSSVIHVVTVDWAEGASEADIQKALDGVATLAGKHEGITRVWLNSFKSQGKDAAFVMEFKDKAALESYAGSDAQKAWYEVYLPVRGRSATSDITN